MKGSGAESSCHQTFSSATTIMDERTVEDAHGQLGCSCMQSCWQAVILDHDVLFRIAI